jgi:BT1 family
MRAWPHFSPCLIAQRRPPSSMHLVQPVGTGFSVHWCTARRAIYTGFSTLPWLLKPVYGFVSDTFPLFGYRRRSYLVLCGIIGSLAWGTLCVSHPGASLATVLLIVGSAGTACSDVVVDSIVVEASRDAPTSVAGTTCV